MKQIKTSCWQQALDAVERLSPEDQGTLIELVERRLVEWRRTEIARNAKATLQAVQEGRSRQGSVENFEHDLADGS